MLLRGYCCMSYEKMWLIVWSHKVPLVKKSHVSELSFEERKGKKKKHLFDRSLSSVSTDYNLFQRQPILQHSQIAIPFEKLLGKSHLTHFSIVLHLNIKGMGGVKVSWVCLDQSQALLVLWKPCKSITLAPVNRHSC